MLGEFTKSYSGVTFGGSSAFSTGMGGGGCRNIRPRLLCRPAVGDGAGGGKDAAID